MLGPTAVQGSANRAYHIMQHIMQPRFYSYLASYDVVCHTYHALAPGVSRSQVSEAETLIGNVKGYQAEIVRLRERSDAFESAAAESQHEVEVSARELDKVRDELDAIRGRAWQMLLATS